MFLYLPMYVAYAELDINLLIKIAVKRCKQHYEQDKILPDDDKRTTTTTTTKT